MRNKSCSLIQNESKALSSGVKPATLERYVRKAPRRALMADWGARPWGESIFSKKSLCYQFQSSKLRGGPCFSGHGAELQPAHGRTGPERQENKETKTQKTTGETHKCKAGPQQGAGGSGQPSPSAAQPSWVSFGELGRVFWENQELLKTKQKRTLWRTETSLTLTKRKKRRRSC